MSSQETAGRGGQAGAAPEAGEPAPGGPKAEPGGAERRPLDLVRLNSATNGRTVLP